jgi:hypothetical protein
VFDTESPASLTLLHALGRRGVPVHVFGPGRFPPGRLSPYCAHAETCPDPVRFHEFQTWLRERLSSGAITRVAPTSDLIAYHCAALRDAFPPQVRDTIHSLDEIETVLIKSRLNERCRALDLPFPTTWYPESSADAEALAPALPYPVIIKPRSHLGVGTSYRGAVVHAADEFLAAFGPRAAAIGQEPLLERYPELRWPMVQRYPAAGPPVLHSFLGLRDHRTGIVAEAMVYKTDAWPPVVGIGTEFVTFDDPVTRAAGRRVVDAVLSHGLFHIEMLVEGEGRLIIDVNPRAYQAISLDIARGNDLPWLWYRSTLEPVPVQAPPAAGMSWRRKSIFHLSHWTRVVGGPDRGTKWRRYRELLRTPAVGGTEGSPLVVRLACELRLLRHPRSLVRPYWREPE